MEEIYLDNAATTQPYEEVVQAVADAMRTEYANPSSLHTLGMKAEKALKKSRNILAKAIGAKPSEIYFTSGGSESDNTALIGYAMAHKKRFRKIITSKVEHDAVLEPTKRLKEAGFEVAYVDVLENGVLDLEAFQKELTPDTGLVSIMSVNNEVGAIQPIGKLKTLMQRVCPQAVLHVDHVQGFGKVPLHVHKQGVDLLSISGHKIHGPKGIGVLYVKDGVRVSPLILGGHQEQNVRSGTQSIYDIVGLSVATEKNLSDEKNEYIRSLKNSLAQKIEETIPDVCFNTDLKTSAPHVLNVSFPGLRSEVLLHSLEAKGIFVSTGSACASNKPELSHTLLAMGRTHAQIDSAVRFSFSEFNTEEQIDYTVKVLKEEVASLRKYMGGKA